MPSTVLLVDDDPGALETAGLVLRTMGLHVRRAASGEEAIGLARACLIAVVALFGPLSFVGQAAQDADDVRTRFDVVSIRSNQSGSGRISVRDSGWHYVAQNIRVTMLLSAAYRVPVESMLNVPGWARSERFDVEARIVADDPAAVPIDRRALLRNLLADRFGAVIREVTTNSDGYALVAGREDGRLGPQLKRSMAECSTETTPAPAPRPSARVPCRIASNVEGSLSGIGVSLTHIADFLGRRAGLVIVDRTGLDGLYDFDLMWAPVQPGAALSPSPDPLQPMRAELFTAVREQLGLRLEPQEVPQGTIYIEAIERPTPN